MAQEGAKVVISSRQKKKVDQAVATLRAEGLEVSGISAHVAKDRSRLIEFTVQTYGGIDIIVNNAAINLHTGFIMETEESQAVKTLEVNVLSGFLLVKEALPYLERSQEAGILFMTSYLGYIPNNMLGFYSVSKAALLGLVKCMALELTLKGIRVNGIAPAVVKTEFSKMLWETEYAKNNPMSRMCMPEEVAATAAFLLSKDASYVSGEVVVMSGAIPTRL